MRVKNMVWAWVNPSTDFDPFWINRDHSRSTFDSFHCPHEKDLLTGVTFYDAKRYAQKRIKSYNCLNVAGSERIVDQLLLGKLSVCLNPTQVLYRPVFVQAKDAVLESYSVVIIKNCLPCLNPAKSNIKSWVVEGEFTIDYDGISFRDDCLGSLDIAADTMTGHVIVSDRVKDELSKHNFKGLYFSQGVDLWM